MKGKLYSFNDKIYFSPGTITHESVHIGQTKIVLLDIMNKSDGFPQILSLNLGPLEFYTCPEKALMVQKDRVQQYLAWELIFCNDLKTRMGSRNGQPVSELNADQGATKTYKLIRDNIKDWAELQTWWNPKKCK